MLIEDRVSYVVDLFIELIKANGDKEIEIEGAKYTVKSLLTITDLRNKLITWIMDDSEKWQKIFRFFGDSYGFVTGQSDDSPDFEREY